MRYQIDWEQKKTMFITAKNKIEARKKAKERLGKGTAFFKIAYIEENEHGFFM